MGIINIVVSSRIHESIRLVDFLFFLFLVIFSMKIFEKPQTLSKVPSGEEFLSFLFDLIFLPRACVEKEFVFF